MWSFWMNMNIFKFFIVCIYLYCCWKFNYQEGRVGIPLTSLTPQLFVCLSQTRTWISNVICSDLFYVQWVEERCDCSFSWYWWNYWPSLFKLFFPQKCIVCSLCQEIHVTNCLFLYFVYLKDITFNAYNVLIRD